MALTEAQRRKGREKLAARRGVAINAISDEDLASSISAGEIRPADCGSYESGSSASYDGGGSSSSSYSSSSSSSSDSGSSGGGGGGGGD